MAVTCLGMTSFIAGTLSFIFFSISIGTRRWKEDIVNYKGMRKYIGLWQGCVKVSEDSFAGLPEYYECDKDFLRPKLVEPPDWFISVRVLMILAVLGTGFSLILFVTAIVTENCKKTGSKYSPAAALNAVGALCGMVALIIFVTHFQWSVEYAYAAGHYYALYWHEEPEETIVNGVFFAVETFVRWSYYMGWIGVFFSIISIISGVLADIIRKAY